MAGMSGSAEGFAQATKPAAIGKEAEDVPAEQEERHDKHDRQERRRHLHHAPEHDGGSAAEEEEYGVANNRATRFPIRDFEGREFSHGVVGGSGHQVIFAFNTRFEMLASATAGVILPS